MRRDDLAPEAAAVAAFLSDISAFLDDEEDPSSSSSNVHQHIQLTAYVQNETLDNNVTARQEEEEGQEKEENQPKRPLPEDEAKRKRNIQTGKRRDAYRKRLKEEWRTLRGEEVELAARLEEMQQIQREDRGRMARSAWRAMAMRQLEGRQAAEAQQERLRAAVKRRRELIQDVEDTLRKRLREVEKTCNPGRGLAGGEGTDERLFEAYLGELDAIYARTDDVFESSEAEPRTGPFLNTRPTKKRDGDTEYFENVGVLRVPFEFKRACLALWAVTRQPYRQLDREEYTRVLDVENTIAVRFRVKCRLPTGGLVSILTHFVARRYVEEGRTVIIWRELWEGEGEFEGMHSDETGWCTIQPREGALDAVVSTDDVPGNYCSIVQTCVRLVPMHFSSNISCDPDFDRFTEVLVTSGKEDNAQVQHIMEQLQLHHALAQVRPENS